MTKAMNITSLMNDMSYIVHRCDPYDRLEEIFPGKEGHLVLEAGCGSGKLGLSYALGGCEAYLIDIDPSMLAYSRRLRAALNILIGYPLPVEIKHMNLFRMKFPESKFDLVFNEGVVDHFPEDDKRQEVIDCMTRASKDFVVVMVSNGLNPREVKKDQEDTFEYAGMPPHRRSFQPAELELRLKKAGLKDIVVEPLYPQIPKESPILVGWGRKNV